MAKGGLRGFAALALAALCIAVLAQAQTGAPTDLQSSRCWTCHKVGGPVQGSPVKVMYSLHPPSSIVLEAGKPTPLRLDVRNDWVAELHNIAGTLDLSRAPSLGFQPPPEPELNVRRTGTLTFEAGQLNDPERSAIVIVPIPAGATAVRVTLTPDRANGPDAPDLKMRVWGEGVLAKPERAVETETAGKGASEVFRRASADGVAALGYGSWSVAAVQDGFATKPDAAALQAQGFTVVVDSWFNLTGERTQLVGSVMRLDGGDEAGARTAVLQWNLFVRAQPQAGEELVFTVNLVASFVHAPQFNAVDDWAYTQILRVPIRAPLPATSGGPGPPPLTTIKLNTTPAKPVVDTTSARVLTEVSLGEIVGYFTAFVMLVSLVTGGVLGGASRRWLNRVLTSAQRRIAFHNLTSYLILLAAAAHTWLFIDEAEFPWTVGLLWGGLGILALTALGITGAWQLPLIRRWHYTPWRVVHYTCAILAVAFTVLHIALDGIHFVDLQRDIGWQDPVVRLLGDSG